MTSPINRIRLTFALFALLLFSSPAFPDTLPCAEDINDLAQKAKQIADSFFSQTFTIRMQYEYSGRFLNRQDRDTLSKLAEKASAGLDQIANTQLAFKQSIESYDGNDWESRFGQTGLWRKLTSDVLRTMLSKFEIQYHLAIASDPPVQVRMFREILRQMDSLSQTYKQSGPELVRVKVLSQLGRIDSNFRTQALKELEKFALYSDILRPVGARIEKIKLAGRADPNELSWLITVLSQNRSERHRELVLQTAFLQRKYDPNGFEKMFDVFPETQDILGALALSEISALAASDEDLSQITVTEAELAAHAAWRSNTNDCKSVLERLADSENFQTPLVLYVAAVASAESSPAKAVDLLIKASILQQKQNSARLPMDALQIAEQAARIACDLSARDPNSCPLAVRAFDNYCELAAENIEDELAYRCAATLSRCGEVQKAMRLLQKIADSPGRYQNHAKLDLLAQQIQQSVTDSEKNVLLERLAHFIQSIPAAGSENSPLHARATALYCHTLLERGDTASAEKVIEILDKTSSPPSDANLFRAKALHRLNRLPQAAHFAILALSADCNTPENEIVPILSEIIDRIEYWQTQTGDANQLLSDCEQIARFAHKSSPDANTALFLAEMLILTSDPDKTKLSQAEKLLSAFDDSDNIILLRCKARLLTAQADYQKAAELWAGICDLSKPQTQSINTRTWQWWQGKFYQLDSLAKLHNSNTADISHTIEILLNTYPDIPLPWAEKLLLLKEQCRSTG